MILHFAFYNAAQLVPVSGDQVFFFLAASHIDGDIVGVCDDQRAAALEAGDVVDFGICQLQDALYALRFLFLQIQNDFDFAVVQDAAAVFSIFQGKEVVQILRGNQHTAAIAANRLDGLEHIVGRQSVGRCADDLPDFVYKNLLAAGQILFRLILHIVQPDVHTHRQQVAGQLADVDDDIAVVKVHVRLAVEA